MPTAAPQEAAQCAELGQPLSRRSGPFGMRATRCAVKNDATKAKGHPLRFVALLTSGHHARMATVFLALVTGSSTLPNLQPVVVASNDRYCAQPM